VGCLVGVLRAHPVCVDAEQHRGTVADPSGDRGDAEAFAEELCRREVPEIVEPDSLDAEAPAQPCEAVRDDLGMPGPACIRLLGEHVGIPAEHRVEQGRYALLVGPQLTESRHGVGVESERASRPGTLREVGDDEAGTGAIELHDSEDRHRRLVEVDLRPAQPAQLATPASRRDRDAEKGGPARVAVDARRVSLVEDLLDDRHVGRRRLGRPSLRWRRVLGRVLPDPAPPAVP